MLKKIWSGGDIFSDMILFITFWEQVIGQVSLDQVKFSLVRFPKFMVNAVNPRYSESHYSEFLI